MPQRQREDRQTVSIEQLRAAYDTRPFQPFTLHVADGRRLRVKSREFIFLVPNGHTVVVYQPDGSMHIVDLSFVSDLKKTRATKGGKRRKTT